MQPALDFWGEELAVGDHVVYCLQKVPRLGRIEKISSSRLTIRELFRKRDHHYEDEFDLRTPRNVIKAPEHHVTLRYLKAKSHELQT